tara:strand:- start:133 stop:684 length:552 start_codon:yes stop_codon:yes gene_type:complete
MKQVFNSFSVDVENDDDYKCPRMVELNIKLKNWTPNTKLTYVAAQSPDYLQSFTGSALPFADAEQAFDQTPNFGELVPKLDSFKIELQYPNAYYSHLGTRLIPPYVRITVEQNGKKNTEYVVLGEIAPFRLLSYQSTPVARYEPGFYDRGILKKGRTQEAILRASGYKMETPSNFWGGAISHP